MIVNRMVHWQWLNTQTPTRPLPLMLLTLTEELCIMRGWYRTIVRVRWMYYPRRFQNLTTIWIHVQWKISAADFSCRYGNKLQQMISPIKWQGGKSLCKTAADLLHNCSRTPRLSFGSLLRNYTLDFNPRCEHSRIISAGIKLTSVC